MSVVPIGRAVTAVAAVAPDLVPDDLEQDDAMTVCGRCRLSFVRHPSIGSEDSSKWWLCPPCRTRMLGDVSKTNARWARGA
jgi:hypothetical protein